jgi:hypothetical protein
MKKSHARDCFCALCRSPRKLRYTRSLKSRHYLQILVLALVATAATWPWLTWKGALSLPIIFMIFDSTYKSLYRKDLKCPYCGFDPAWYKKDVKFARQKVEEFLRNNPDSPVAQRARSLENSLSNLQ